MVLEADRKEGFYKCRKTKKMAQTTRPVFKNIKHKSLSKYVGEFKFIIPPTHFGKAREQCKLKCIPRQHPIWQCS